MSQSDFVIETIAVNGNDFAADVQAALRAAVTLSAGTGDPPATYPQQWKLDTGAAPWVLNVRNAANDAWIPVIEIDDGDDEVRLIAKLLTMTGQILAAGGTVGAPGIAFSGDPDTGIYRIGANNLGLVANGAPVLEIADRIALFRKQVRSSVLTLTSATAIAVDLAAENVQLVTLDHNATFTLSGAALGQWATLWIRQGATGGTAAWSGVTRWQGGGAAPSLSTVTGDYDVVSLFVPEAGVVVASHMGP
jgi:hypothetical protein